MIIGDDDCFWQVSPLQRLAFIRPLHALILFCALVLVLFSTPAQANDNPAYAPLDQSRGSDWLSSHLTGFEDESWAITIDDLIDCEAKACVDKAFTPLRTPSPDFGFTENKIWLRAHLENTSSEQGHWVLHTHENFLQVYEIYILREDGRVDIIEQHDPETLFSDRSINFPELASRFTFAPGERITLYIAYWSGGSSKISLSIETEQDFETKALAQVSKNFMSYGIMLILILASLLALILLRLRVFWAYSVYVWVTLIFLMHSDGVAFQYLWPQFPTFNSYFSIIIGLAFAVVPYNFARIFLRTKEFHPRVDRFMIWMMIITPCLVIPGALIDPQATKKYLMLLVFLAIVIGTWAGLVAAQKRFREVRFYLFAWIVGVASAGLMNLRHFTDIAIGQTLELDSIRVAIVIDAIMMGLGVADRYRQQVQTARAEEKRALEQARQNLRLNTRLQNLEERYRLATELVTTRDKDLKDTVHDLRQPLHALRLNVLSLQSQTDAGPEEQASFEDTFTYLETLITRYLEESIQDRATPAAPIAAEHDQLNLSSVLRSVHEMFLPDAEAKGLEFTYVETSLETSVDALSLMRIVTNLVANAIKYTKDGKILLGARPSSDVVTIEVHDTGSGMTQAEFEAAQARSVRLETSASQAQPGQGFGLAIATKLAKKVGGELAFRTGRTKGTSLLLRLPRHMPKDDADKTPAGQIV